MAQTRTARNTQSRLAAATRDYGTGSAKAITAHRNYRTARLASLLLDAREELGGWTRAERAAIIDALDGKEVAPDPDHPSALWSEVHTEELSSPAYGLGQAKRDMAAYLDWSKGLTYIAIAKKHNYVDGGAARKAVQAASRVVNNSLRTADGRIAMPDPQLLAKELA